MNSDLVHDIAKARTCVAFLGEKDQKNWWGSSFLSRSGEAFLRAVYPKTNLLARINGASAAAQTQHDDRIGTGDVYHLFRLPEIVEQHISTVLTSEQSFKECISSEEIALQCLESIAEDANTHGQGPLLIKSNGLDTSVLKQIAAAYLQAFKESESVYPYFRSTQ